jgi:hypothetical protein
MASVTYNPPADDAQSVTWGGKTFNAGEAVEVNDPLLLSKAKTNRFFEVSAGEDEQRQAEVVGGYADANTGDEVALVRTRRLPAYATGAGRPDRACSALGRNAGLDRDNGGGSERPGHARRVRRDLRRSGRSGGHGRV